MKRLLGLLLTVVLFTGLLGGCTNATKDASNPSTEKEEKETSSTETTTTFPITYTDARGKKVIIEKKPERIAVANWMITEKLLAMDVAPIASDTVAIMSGWASMKEYFETYQIQDLGTEVNLEMLLEMKPDLILATTANEAIYDKLEAIAPVVVFDVNVMFGDWQTSIREVANAIGQDEAAESFILDLMQQMNQIKNDLSMDGKNVAFLRLWSKTIYSMGIDTCAAFYDKENGLGLEIPTGWPQEIGALSLESLAQINPDYIFLSSSEDEAYLEDLRNNAVWNTLTAVKEEHVYSIDISGLSGGALAAKYGIQVVEDNLIK